MRLYSQTASMAWMNDGIEMDTHTGGGLFITEYREAGAMLSAGVGAAALDSILGGVFGGDERT